MIKYFLDQDQGAWDKHINDFQFAYKTAVNSSTKLTPAFINFGRELTAVNTLRREPESSIPVEKGNLQEWTNQMYRLKAIRYWITHIPEMANDRQTRYYNRNHRIRTFEQGDKVYIRNRELSNKAKRKAAKLLSNFKDPYTVTQVLSPVIYKVLDTDTDKVKKLCMND